VGDGPLSGVKVVEIAALGAVPHAVMMLADAGADVVRVDRPVGPSDADDLVARGRRGNAVTRGRRSLTVDLKHESGAEVVLELVARADVFVEGFRPGVAERLGLGPDACFAVNAALVYGRLTGWGRVGELAPRAGHDINYLALSGSLAAIGPADRPPPVPLNLVADFGGGSMQLAFGIAAALVDARTSGRGRIVDAAMVDGVATQTTYIHSMRAAGTWVDARSSNVLDGGAPFYGVYETSDGGWVAVGAIEPAFYEQLVAGLEFDPDELPPQLDRSSWPATKVKFAERFATRSRAEWAERFAGVDACVTPVLTMEEAPSHPHLAANGTFVDIAGVVQPAPTPRFDGHRSTPTPPVAAGVGGREALADWGVDDADVERWCRDGVVHLVDGQ